VRVLGSRGLTDSAGMIEVQSSQLNALSQSQVLDEMSGYPGDRGKDASGS